MQSFVAKIIGTDDENEIRDRAQRHQQRISPFEAKKSSPEPNRQSPPQTLNVMSVRDRMPFGHRGLARELKETPRVRSPMIKFMELNPQDQFLIDRVIQQVQLAANGSMNVCLVAFDVYSNRDADEIAAEIGAFGWTKIVLFFRFEPVNVKQT